jgi:hypothetical protein
MTLRQTCCLLLLVPVLAAGGCRGRGHTASPDGRDLPHVAEAIDRHAPTVDDLLNLSFTGTMAGDVTLTDGAWAGPPAEPGAASRPRLQLVRGFSVTGDLDGDGNDEAVVQLAYDEGGSGTVVHIAAVGVEGGRLTNLATTVLGDRVRVESGRIEDGRIVLDVLRPLPEDPMCCPTGRFRLTLRVRGHAMQRVGDEPR